jgi:hypothetical protein
MTDLYRRTIVISFGQQRAGVQIPYYPFLVVYRGLIFVRFLPNKNRDEELSGVV